MSDGHVWSLIRRCTPEFSNDDRLLSKLVTAVALSASDPAPRQRHLLRRVARRAQGATHSTTDHPRVQRAVARPKIHTVVQTVARNANLPHDVVRSVRGARWRGVIAWIGWHEGLTTLRSIAAALRLRSESHVSNLIRRCSGEFGRFLESLDTAVALLRA